MIEPDEFRKMAALTDEQRDEQLRLIRQLVAPAPQIQSRIVCRIAEEARTKYRIEYKCSACGHIHHADLWNGDPTPPCPKCTDSRTAIVR